MTIVQQQQLALLVMLGLGGKIVHPPGGPTPGPKYSYMGHVLSLPCTVINDPTPGAQLMIS